ncbi:MAG: tRNA uracil 4-sulfurtransferase ThiI [Succinivibrionaceae bacterium]
MQTQEQESATPTAQSGEDVLNQLYPNIFLIKLFSEIIIKSHSVRMSMIKVLNSNIRNVLKHFGIKSKISSNWDKIMVRCDNSRTMPELVEILGNIPGIHSILEVKSSTFTDLHNIYEQTKELYQDKLAGKTFCVRVKRKGNHEFKSIDAEKYIGGGLNQNVPSAGVKLTDPDVQINIEIDDRNLYLIKNSHRGLGGYPLSTQEDVLSLISGGFDSGVSSFRFIKRGCKVHYCFFNMGGRDHEVGVQQEAYYLWNKYGSSHRVKFFAIPFEDVVGEILENVNKHLMGVILKRMMMRAASQIAAKVGAKALVTGESVGQVSSQTITNLSVITDCCDTMILRPLIVSDKQDIINECRLIGTEEIAASMPEYCGVISQKPATHAKLADVEAEESHFNFKVLEDAVAKAQCLDIRDIGEKTREEIQEVDTVDTASGNDIIIDIRSKDEAEDEPLQQQNVPVLSIPFYKIATSFGDLDQSKQYLLYCKNGVMSRIQALFLREKGYTNVRIYRIPQK